jgi:hypothetical protein
VADQANRSALPTPPNVAADAANVEANISSATTTVAPNRRLRPSVTLDRIATDGMEKADFLHPPSTEPVLVYGVASLM